MMMICVLTEPNLIYILQVLDVSKNALAEVPDAISGLKSLIVLDLSVNPLGK